MSTTFNIDTAKFGIEPSFYTELKKVHSILSNDKNSIFVLHDSDSDGLCSYLQLKNSFKSIRGGHFITKEEEVQKIALQLIHPKTTHVFFLDTPSIDTSIITQILELNMQIIVIDHHTIDKKLLKSYKKEKNITYINPLLYNSLDSRPITYFSYLLSDKSLITLEYALIGSVADFYITPIFLDALNYEIIESSPLLKTFDTNTLQNITKNLKENPLYYIENKIENAQIIQKLSYSTPIGTCKQFFDFVFKNTLKSYEHTKLIQSFNSINELLAEINAAQYPPFSEFDKYTTKYKKILQKAYVEFDKQNNKNNTNSSVLIIEHKGKTSYNRQLSEQALYEKDVSISCSMHQKYERAFISGSIRSIPSIDLHEVLQKIFQDTNYVKWGGHPQACGFQFPEEFREEFKEKLLNSL